MYTYIYKSKGAYAEAHSMWLSGYNGKMKLYFTEKKLPPSSSILFLYRLYKALEFVPF